MQQDIYNGRYTVFSDGRIFSNKRNIFIRPCKDIGGYLDCVLRTGGEPKTKHHRVHVLVASLFLPNPDNLKEVNHIDGDKTNPALTNLEWVDRKSNMKHASETGIMSVKNLSAETKDFIRRKNGEGMKLNHIAELLGMSRARIRRAL